MLALNNWAWIADEAVRCKNACVFTSVDRKKATLWVAFFVVKSVPEPVDVLLTEGKKGPTYLYGLLVCKN